MAILQPPPIGITEAAVAATTAAMAFFESSLPRPMSLNSNRINYDPLPSTHNLELG
jgi:hypothetical protein